MELRNLQTFAKIVELKSFSNAAKALGYTQSSITAQIKTLENELGVLLLDRVGSKVYLTDMGRRILGDVNKIITSTNHIKTITSSPDKEEGIIRMGALFSLYHPYLPDIIREYHKKYPEVNLMIDLGVTHRLEKWLNTNYVDFILTLDERYNYPYWEKVAEYYTPAVFFCSPHHKLTQKKIVTIADIINEELILTRTNCNYRLKFENILAQKGQSITPILETDDMLTIIDFVHDGNAISLLPLKTIKKSLEEGYLSQLNVPELQIDMWTQIFYHKYKYLTPMMKKLITMIQKNMFEGETAENPKKI